MIGFAMYCAAVLGIVLGAIELFIAVGRKRQTPLIGGDERGEALISYLRHVKAHRGGCKSDLSTVWMKGPAEARGHLHSLWAYAGKARSGLQ